MALVLKSNSKYTGPELAAGMREYVDRVVSSGGEIHSTDELTDAFLFAIRTGLNSDRVFSATSPSWGRKLDSEGKITELYSLFGESGDILITGGVDMTNASGKPFSHFFSSSDRGLSRGVSEKVKAVVAVSGLMSGAVRPFLGFVSDENVNEFSVNRSLTIFVNQTDAQVLAGTTQVDTQGSFSVPASVGGFLGNSALSLIVNGQEFTSPATNHLGTPAPYRVVLGGDGTNRTAPNAVGEAWALSDCELEQVLAISRRHVSNYGISVS